MLRENSPAKLWRQSREQGECITNVSFESSQFLCFEVLTLVLETQHRLIGLVDEVEGCLGAIRCYLLQTRDICHVAGA